MNKESKNKLQEPHDFARHGEVILKKVSEIPAGAKLVEERNSVIVGHSESGHHHVLEAENGVMIKMYEIDGKTYLDLPSKGNLIHQKSVESHGTQVIERGIYIREIRQSYSYAEKIMKRVID